MTATPLPAEWTRLPRAIRDRVLRHLIDARLGGRSPDARQLLRAGVHDKVPASLEQQFFLEQQERFAGRLAWTIGAPPMILDTVDAEAVRTAVAALARRHDALHTTFRKTAGGYHLHLDPEAPPPLKVVTLPLTATVTGPELWVRRRFGAMLAEPFDPEAGPLWRAELIVRAGRGVLLSCFCSAIVDGESLRIVERDLKALLATPDSPEPPPAHRYADYAFTQADQLRAGRFEEPLRLLRQRLSGTSPAGAEEREAPLRLQRRRLAGDAPIATPKRAPLAPAPLHEMALGPETGRRLDAFAAARRTTAPAVLLSAFLDVLHEIDGGDDILVAAATATRHLPGTQEMVGTFASQVLLRHRRTPEVDPLAAAHGLLLEAMDQEPVPHLLVRRMLDADGRDPALAFRYVFNHRIVGPQEDDDTVDRDVPYAAGSRHATANREEDILFMVLQSGEIRRLHWYLRSDRFDDKAAERLLARFHATLLSRIEAG